MRKRQVWWLFIALGVVVLVSTGVNRGLVHDNGTVAIVNFTGAALLAALGWILRGRFADQ